MSRLDRDLALDWLTATPEQILAVADEDVPDGSLVEEVEKGDLPGHEFHGNQWTGGLGGGYLPDRYPHGLDPDFLSSAQAEQRLLGVYGRARAAGLAESARDWYAEKGREVAAVADQVGVDQRMLTAMVAVTSRSTAWDTPHAGTRPNLQNALTALRLAGEHPDVEPGALARLLEHPGMMRAPLEAAIRIARGQNPDDVIEGPKERSFFNNLRGDTRSVTADTHMAEIMLDQRQGYGGGLVEQLRAGRTGGRGLPLKGGYGWMVDRIRAANAASDSGLSDPEFQAVVWSQYRQEQPWG